MGCIRSSAGLSVNEINPNINDDESKNRHTFEAMSGEGKLKCNSIVGTSQRVLRSTPWSVLITLISITLKNVGTKRSFPNCLAPLH